MMRDWFFAPAEDFDWRLLSYPEFCFAGPAVYEGEWKVPASCSCINFV